MNNPTLTSLFGYSPRVELLELLSTYAGDEVSVPFLAQHAQASTATLYKYLEKLVAEGLARPTSKTGTTQYYTLNLDNREARLISYLANTFLANAIADQLHERGAKTLAGELEEQSLAEGGVEAQASVPQAPATA